MQSTSSASIVRSRLPAVAALASLFFASCGLAATEPKAPVKLQLTMEEAVQKVQQKTDGRILSASSMRRGKGHTYRIKVLTNDGRVRIAEVDSDKPFRLDWRAPGAESEKENE